MVTLNLPGGAVTLEPGPAPGAAGPWTRTAYAAAHVVADPLAEADPWLDCALDWDRTLAFREHLWSLGFGVAEAMDTSPGIRLRRLVSRGSSPEGRSTS